jgi:hypothetical protein
LLALSYTEEERELWAYVDWRLEARGDLKPELAEGSYRRIQVEKKHVANEG